MRAGSAVLATSTRCKLLVDEVGELVETLGESSSTAELSFFADKVRETEKALARAAADYPDDAEIADTEARLRSVMRERGAARRALERAWSLGPRGSGVALRLAEAYGDAGEADRAVSLLEKAIDRSPDDRQLHLAMAKHLIRRDPEDPRIEPHLSSSHTRGDNAFEARHLHAQFLLLRGRGDQPVALFDRVDADAPQTFRQRTSTTPSIISPLFPTLKGKVIRIESTFLFLFSSSYPRSVYAHSDYSDSRVWDAIEIGDEVEFNVGFTRKGLVGVNLKSTVLRS